MTETPQETADRADRVVAKCRDRGQASLADVENLGNGIHGLAEECQQLYVELANANARLAEIGETTQEWALRGPAGHVGLTYKANSMGVLAKLNPTHTPVRRIVGEWRDCQDNSAQSSDATHSCDNCLGIDPDTCFFNGAKESRS